MKTIEISRIQIALGTAAVVFTSLLAGYASYRNALEEIQREFQKLRNDGHSYIQKEEIRSLFGDVERKVDTLTNKVDSMNARVSTIEGYLRRRVSQSDTPNHPRRPPYYVTSGE